METLSIYNLIKTVEIIINDNLSINSTKRMTIYKSEVVKLRLVDNPETLDLIKIHYVNGDTDELHFMRVTEIDGVQPTSNLDLYEKLKTIFDA